jgi:hypothetical protein
MCTIGRLVIVTVNISVSLAYRLSIEDSNELKLESVIFLTRVYFENRNHSGQPRKQLWQLYFNQQSLKAKA